MPRNVTIKSQRALRHSGGRVTLPDLATIAMHQFCAHASNKLIVRSPHLGLARLSCRSYRLQVNATSLLDKAATELNTNKYMAPNKYTTINNPTATINSVHKIPLLGLGTWRGEAGQVEHAVETAIRAGCRYPAS